MSETIKTEVPVLSFAQRISALEAMIKDQLTSVEKTLTAKVFANRKTVEELLANEFSGIAKYISELETGIQQVKDEERSAKVANLYTGIRNGLSDTLDWLESQASPLRANVTVTLTVSFDTDGNVTKAVNVAGERKVTKTDSSSSATGETKPRGKAATVTIDGIEYESGVKALDALIARFNMPSDYGAGSNKVETARKLAAKHNLSFSRS